MCFLFLNSGVSDIVNCVSVHHRLQGSVYISWTTRSCGSGFGRIPIIMALRIQIRICINDADPDSKKTTSTKSWKTPEYHIFEIEITRLLTYNFMHNFFGAWKFVWENNFSDFFCRFRILFFKRPIKEPYPYQGIRYATINPCNMLLATGNPESIHSYFYK